MKAIIRHRYGSPDIMQLVEMPAPVPGENDVLIKVAAAAVNPADWRLMRADPFIARFMGQGVFRPKHKILGADVAGVVEATGSAVTRLKPGDQVFGDLSGGRWGGFAEYVAAPEDALAMRPANVSFEEAAAIPLAAITALQGLRDKRRIAEGCKVLVNGASGGVGTFAVQIARSLGAEVTGVCSTSNVEMVHEIGAQRVIDYTKEDFTRSGREYDLVLDAAAYRSMSDLQRLMAPEGVYVLVGGSLGLMLRVGLFGRRKRMYPMLASPNVEDLDTLRHMVESGDVKPVIDRTYPLAEVPEALKYIEQGHARGKVVISV